VLSLLRFHTILSGSEFKPLVAEIGNWNLSHLLQRLGTDCVLMFYLQRSPGGLATGL